MHPELIIFIVAMAGLFASFGALIWALVALAQWSITEVNTIIDIWKDTE